jgi:hypothetical protein
MVGSAARPEWTKASAGILLDTVVRIHGGSPGVQALLHSALAEIGIH